MLGYLTEDNPAVIKARGDDWYDTGDICELDDEGYLWIRGRFKRFAKISGEMVSLAAVEEVAASLWPESRTAVVSGPDAAKGERLVLLHLPDFEPDLAALREAIKAKGLTDLAAPKSSLEIAEIPLNVLGKADMPTIMAKVGPLLDQRKSGSAGFIERLAPDEPWEPGDPDEAE